MQLTSKQHHQYEKFSQYSANRWELTAITPQQRIHTQGNVIRKRIRMHTHAYGKRMHTVNNFAPHHTIYR